MSADYCIGYKRFLACKEEDSTHVVSIYEKDSHKFITIPLWRWAKFVRLIPYLNEQMEMAKRGETVKIREHIGGAMFVSIDTSLKVLLIDLREFYAHKTAGILPTKRGISLRSTEWEKMLTCVERFTNDHRCVREAQPCSSEMGHANQELGLSCRECNLPKFDRE